MTSVVYLWSQYAPISAQYLSFIQEKGGRPICVDHPTIRQRVMSGNIKVSVVPCVLVSSNGKISQYEGDKAIQWIEYHQQKARQPTVQPQVYSQPTVQPQVYSQPMAASYVQNDNDQEDNIPQIKFSMAPTIQELSGEKQPGVAPVSIVQPQMQAPQMQPQPQMPQMQAPQMQPQSQPQMQMPQLPADVTPVSKLIPEAPSGGDRKSFTQQLDNYNQQAMEYYQQFQVAPPQNDPSVRKLSPKEQEFQNILALAKKSADSHEDTPYTMGSAS